MITLERTIIIVLLCALAGMMWHGESIEGFGMGLLIGLLLGCLIGLAYYAEIQSSTETTET